MFPFSRWPAYSGNPPRKHSDEDQHSQTQSASHQGAKPTKAGNLRVPMAECRAWQRRRLMEASARDQAARPREGSPRQNLSPCCALNGRRWTRSGERQPGANGLGLWSIGSDVSLKPHFVTTFSGYVVAIDIFTLDKGYSLKPAFYN